MPKVSPIPVGQDVAAVAGLAERSRSMQAQRNTISLATAPGALQLGAASDSYTQLPPGGPELTVNVGASGSVWVLWSWQTVSTYELLVSVGIDGASPTGTLAQVSGQIEPALSGGYFQASQFAGQAGIAPGWHTFNLWQLTTYVGNVAIVNTTLQVWAL